MSTQEQVVLASSPEAASIQTITGWVSRGGRYWGNDERMARYEGATHTSCACGQTISKHYVYCDACKEKLEIDKFNAMERKPWDGTAMLYADASDQYFGSVDEAEEYAEEQDISLADLRLIICEPNYATQIDPIDHFCDDLPEDGDLPAELHAAFDNLNKAIKACSTPLSWSPGKYALDISTLEAA